MLDRLRRGCKVGFFGLGRSNLSLISTLPLENCSITLRSDSRINPEIAKCAEIYEGCNSLCNIDEDVLFLSPSVKRDRPELINAQSRGVLLTSDYELFLSECKSKIFAITGSDGKSSTARLLSLLLTESGYNAREVGNMGKPMFESLTPHADIYVAELSSFMLSAARPNATVSALTSLSPNHLDWHGSYENYKKTKISLLKSSEKFVISDENADVSGAFGIVSPSRCYTDLRKLYKAGIYVTVEDGYIKRNGERLLPVDQIKRQEEYSLKNLMLAIAMADGLVTQDAILRVARGFSGLAHRCENFLSTGEIDYYDSSIDTSPTRTATTLRSLGREVVIILGGRSKGLDFSAMLPEIGKYVKFAILIGENRNEIYSVISPVVTCHMADTLDEAITIGIKLARNVGALLLSPASASYDMFTGYEARGDMFKKLVQKGIENEKNLS